jgi:ABC-2 type transport system ATP-binding protein/lipopolysaccharide transport system ATP-binding protein
MTRIEIKNIDVHFPIYDARARSFRHRLLGIGAGRIGATATHRVVVRALNDISLSLAHGDRLGLIGRNGAGKSTLLRVMSGIYEPGAGSVRVIGRLAALTDLTMGMDMEGTGYENVLIRGFMLGLTRRQSLDRIGEIEAFTELGDYLNLPLRTYSQGMLLRLAFAISTSIEPEILILDEMIGAGDKRFAEKANERLNRLTEAARILVVASHAPDTLRRLCNKAALLREGRLIDVGPVEEILSRYEAEG